jgi:hypothetical protein
VISSNPGIKVSFIEETVQNNSNDKESGLRLLFYNGGVINCLDK